MSMWAPPQRGAQQAQATQHSAAPSSPGHAAKAQHSAARPALTLTRLESLVRPAHSTGWLSSPRSLRNARAPASPDPMARSPRTGSVGSGCRRRRSSSAASAAPSLAAAAEGGAGVKALRDSVCWI